MYYVTSRLVLDLYYSIRTSDQVIPDDGRRVENITFIFRPRRKFFRFRKKLRIKGKLKRLCLLIAGISALDKVRELYGLCYDTELDELLSKVFIEHTIAAEAECVTDEETKKSYDELRRYLLGYDLCEIRFYGANSKLMSAISEAKAKKEYYGLVGFTSSKRDRRSIRLAIYGKAFADDVSRNLQKTI